MTDTKHAGGRRLTASGRKEKTTQTVAWQGWSLTVPASWNPVRIDGDSGEGSLLLADLHAPRLGLRWKTAAERGDPDAWAARSLADEVGALAAAEAAPFAMTDAGDWRASRVYVDPAPPGRDVWVGHSRRSGRVLQVVHHAAERGGDFAGRILPSLADAPGGSAVRWSVFDFSFVTRPGLVVQWYRFNAGDLSVGLADERRAVTVVRQIGPASLALTRQPLAAWHARQPAATRRVYRPVQDSTGVALGDPGLATVGLRGTLFRKRRLGWAWFIPPRQTVISLHAGSRDRLLLGQSADEAGLLAVLGSVGWNAADDAAVAAEGDAP